MTKKLDKYIIDVDYDYETGEEHTTVLKTDQTQNMENWETLVITMYVHHSIFKNVVAELNKLDNINEQLKKSVKRQQSSNEECAKLIQEQQKENEKLKVRIDTFIEGNRTLQARLKEVSIENKNTKAVLEDFMDILNKIQVNPTDEKLLNVARDMLQNMGVIE